MGIVLFILASVGGVLLGRKAALVKKAKAPAPAPTPPVPPPAQEEARTAPTPKEQHFLKLAKDDPRMSQLFAEVLVRPVIEKEGTIPQEDFEREMDHLAVLMQHGFFTIEEARKVSHRAALLLETRFKPIGIGFA